VCRLLGTVALGSSWHLRLFRGSEWHGSLSAVPRPLVFHLAALELDYGLLESLLDDGAGADKARWRRAVLTIEPSKPRLVGEKEGAGDCGHGRAAIARKKRTGSTSQICSLICL